MNPVDQAMGTERPLISFCVFAYNQERFIREAVEGAFAQTYSPLEIILSDDHSPDRTYDIIQEMAVAYKGPHRVVTNRNECNMGIGAHVTHVVNMARGEWIVGAAGDDISMPDRTQAIYDKWLETGKQAYSIDSAMVLIDENGTPYGETSDRHLPAEQQLLCFSETMMNFAVGAAHAWHRKVFDVFGGLPDIISEDFAIPPRSMLLGKVSYVDKQLVKYRKHAANVYNNTRRLSGADQIKRYERGLADSIKIIDDIVRCIRQHKEKEPDAGRIDYLNRCIANLERHRDIYCLKLKMLMDPFVMRVRAAMMYGKRYGFSWKDKLYYMSAISPFLYWIACMAVRPFKAVSAAFRKPMP